MLFFFFTFKESTFRPTPSQQNNLTGVFSTASKTRSQLILTWSQQFISVIMSCSHCKTAFARLALSRPRPAHLGVVSCGRASGPGAGPATVGSGAGRPDGGDGGRRGAGSTGTLEQAVRGREVPAGSLGWRWAAGGLCRVCREVRKSQPWARASHCALRRRPASCRGVFSAVSPSGSEQRPSSKPQGGQGDGLR